jgi:hypothetical protein
MLLWQGCNMPIVPLKNCLFVVVLGNWWIAGYDLGF